MLKTVLKLGAAIFAFLVLVGVLGKMEDSGTLILFMVCMVAYYVYEIDRKATVRHQQLLDAIELSRQRTQGFDDEQ